MGLFKRRRRVREVTDSRNGPQSGCRQEAGGNGTAAKIRFVPGKFEAKETLVAVWREEDEQEEEKEGGGLPC